MTGPAQPGRQFPLDVGDRAPPTSLPNQHGEQVSPAQDSFAGAPTVLALYPSVTDPAATRELHGFRDCFDAITRHDARLFVVSRDPVDTLAELSAKEGYPFMLLSDAEGTAFKRHGLLRLDHHPPILILPRLVNDRFCQHLLALWQQEESRGTQPNAGSSDQPRELGELIERDDAYGKIRQYVLQDQEALGYLDYVIKRRLVPEMMKAFQTKISKRERFVMTRYAREAGGFLAPHRDNHSPQTRHRRFTLSVVLNGGAYEGGELRFKEYGTHLYDFDPGTGVVWAGGLLHGVLPVTKGQRFVTGAHLFGE